MGGCGLDLSVSGYGPLMKSCKHSSEPSGSIKSEIVGQLNYCQIFRKDCVPWSQSVCTFM